MISVSWVPPLNSLAEAWNQSSDGTLGYEIYRSPAFSSGDAFMTVSTHRLYEDHDVVANTEYAYRIKPFTVNGERSFGQAPLSPTLICIANFDVECYMNYTWSNPPSPTPTPPEDSESKFGSEFTLHLYLGLGIAAFVLFCVAPAIIYFCCIRTSKR